MILQQVNAVAIRDMKEMHVIKRYVQTDVRGAITDYLLYQYTTENVWITDSVSAEKDSVEMTALKNYVLMDVATMGYAILDQEHVIVYRATLQITAAGKNAPIIAMEKVNAISKANVSVKLVFMDKAASTSNANKTVTKMGSVLMVNAAVKMTTGENIVRYTILRQTSKDFSAEMPAMANA